MTDEQRIGEAGAQNVMQPEPAASDDPERGASTRPAGSGTDRSEEAWEQDERNEEAATHGSP